MIWWLLFSLLEWKQRMQSPHHTLLKWVLCWPKVVGLAALETGLIHWTGTVRTGSAFLTPCPANVLQSWLPLRSNEITDSPWAVQIIATRWWKPSSGGDIYHPLYLYYSYTNWDQSSSARGAVHTHSLRGCLWPGAFTVSINKAEMIASILQLGDLRQRD